jgi:hypothetical protein
MAGKTLAWFGRFGVAATLVALAAAGISSPSMASTRLSANSSAKLGASMPAVPTQGTSLANAPVGLQAAVQDMLGRAAHGRSPGWTEQQELSVTGASYFGWSAAIHGNHAVVGAPGNETAYPFKFSLNCPSAPPAVWCQQGGGVVAPVPGSSDEFGRSVAIAWPYIVVGAPKHNFAAGEAYVFKHVGGSGNGGWGNPPAILSQPDTDFFGISVAVTPSGGSFYVAVGSQWDDSDAGAVHVFKHANANVWNFTQKIPPPDGVGGCMGGAVSIRDVYIVAGAWCRNNFAGGAYVFKRGGNGVWAPDGSSSTLIGSDTVASDEFGTSVSVNGNYAIVGAVNAGPGSAQGEAYIFQRIAGTWTPLVDPLSPSDGGGQYGWSVAIHYPYALVGAIDHDARAGAAYVYQDISGTWTETILTDDASEYFGSAVDISGPGDELMVGAYASNEAVIYTP